MLPTSSPRVGWSRTRSFGCHAELPRDDHLLLVAARQRPGVHADRWRADVELGDALLRTLADGGVVTHRAAANGGLW